MRLIGNLFKLLKKKNMKNIKKMWIVGLLVAPVVVLAGCSDSVNVVTDEPIDLPPAPAPIEQIVDPNSPSASGEVYTVTDVNTESIGKSASIAARDKIQELVRESLRIQQDSTLSKEQKATALEGIQRQIREVSKSVTPQ